MSQITTEKTFDLLPHVVDIYEKAGIDSYRKKMQKEYKGKNVDVEEAGLNAILYVLKSLPKVKEEVFQVIAIAEDKDTEDVRKQPLSQTLKELKEIFLDDDLMDFFKSAMQ